MTIAPFSCVLLAQTADPEPALSALSAAGLDPDGVQFLLASDSLHLGRYARCFSGRVHVFDAPVERRDADSYEPAPSSGTLLFHLTALRRLLPHLGSRYILAVPDSLRAIQWRLRRHAADYYVQATSLVQVLRATASFLSAVSAPLVSFPSAIFGPPTPGALLFDATAEQPDFVGAFYPALCTALAAAQRGTPFFSPPLPLEFQLSPLKETPERVAFPRCACRSGTSIEPTGSLAISADFSRPLYVQG